MERDVLEQQNGTEPVLRQSQAGGDAEVHRSLARSADAAAGCGAGVRAASSDTPPVSAGELVYALGRIGYDFPSRGRRDSLKQQLEVAGDPEDPAVLLAHLDDHPADAAALQWTLELDDLPIYFLYPTGPFAADVYATLRRFLREQREEGVERVSIPGTVLGTSPHRAGFDLPVIAPELRGMYSWTTEALVASLSARAGESGAAEAAQDEDVASSLTGFLERVYFELRNTGRDPRERALNFAATNAFAVERVYERAMRENMELDSIEVEESPFGPPGEACWDVKLIFFFFPDRPFQSVRRLYRFTVRVDDVVPATVGPMRSWSIR